MNRQQIIMAVACRSCGAAQGSPCTKSGRKRKTVHPSRANDATKGAKPRAVTKSDGFYTSWEWKRARYEALRIHGNRCQCCGWTPNDTKHGHLVVDHIKPRSKHPSLQLDVNNLQVLCNDCNMGKSNVYEDDYRTLDDWFASLMSDH